MKNNLPDIRLAADWLLQHDSVLEPVIKSHDLASFEPHTDYYAALVNSIIGQQLSVKAATTIKLRFLNLFDGVVPKPHLIIDKPHDELRSCGLSNAKAHYIRDLAEHMLDGRISFDGIGEKSNEDIITMLTDVKGIGEWTVQMFLMFCVGRLDVLATGDLGVRNAIRNLYGFDHAPTPSEVTELAERNKWRPYESVACWYLWRSLDNALS